MSSTVTPEIFESVRTLSNKTSPIGSGINKSLLTPCRRIGLSRKRKTPSSTMMKILATEAESESRIPERYSPLTPVHIGMSWGKRSNKVNFESSSPLLDRKESLEESHDNLISPSVSMERAVKKSLAENYSELLSSNPNPFLEDFDQITSSSSTVDKVIHHEEEVDLLKKGVIRETSTKNISCQNNKSITSRSSKKIQLCEIYDSDDNFQINDKTVGKLKFVSLKKKKFSNGKFYKKSQSEDMMEDLKDCKIPIPKLMHNNIKNLNSSNTNNISSDDDLVGRVKKKRMIISSDDDDDDHACKLNTYKVKSIAEDNIRSQNMECSNNPKVFMGEATNLSTVIYTSDEDADFTSTPDQDRFQKKDLLDKVKNLEVQIKEKRKKLEDLKQASVYKSMHNIEELMKLVEQWKEGCVLGLNGLLTSLRNHGPMDMHRLLNNLRIPKELVVKLCLNIQDGH